MIKTYNWGILAPGNIARKFATELKEVKNAKIVAVASRDLKRAQKFAEDFEIEKAYDNYKDLASDPNIDIIYIASPHSHHAEHAILCLNNKKAVLCEKAFSLNAKEVNKMIEASKRNNTFLTEAFFTPHQPSYKKAKEIIESGKLGKIKYINGWFGFNKAPYDMSNRLFNPKLGGGALLDIGLYPIFDALWFMGTPNIITAQADLSTTGIDQSIVTQLGYNNGSFASIFASFFSTAGVGTDILCENGIIKLRRKSAENQSLEILIPDKKTEKYNWHSKDCGLKNEAINAMKCLDKNKKESNIMPLSFSMLLIKTLDTIRQKAGVKYPGRD
jgi:predicted dehydrogenase